MADTLTKGDVVAWLQARSRSYRNDGEYLARQPGDDDRALAPVYRGYADILETEAAIFTHHGPLPPLPLSWYAHPPSSAARCPDWPEGCGEQARTPAYSPGGPAAVRHREGCQVDAAMRREIVNGHRDG